MGRKGTHKPLTRKQRERKRRDLLRRIWTAELLKETDVSLWDADKTVQKCRRRWKEKRKAPGYSKKGTPDTNTMGAEVRNWELELGMAVEKLVTKVETAIAQQVRREKEKGERNTRRRNKVETLAAESALSAWKEQQWEGLNDEEARNAMEKEYDRAYQRLRQASDDQLDEEEEQAHRRAVYRAQRLRKAAQEALKSELGQASRGTQEKPTAGCHMEAARKDH